MNLKLLVDTKQHRVLLAEAGKDFVDFLFKLIKILLSQSMVVWFHGNIYASAENWSDTYKLTSPAALHAVYDHRWSRGDAHVYDFCYHYAQQVKY